MAGIYIHIPYCKQACTYCNFHFSVSLKSREAMLNAIVKEIGLSPKDDDEVIETIYFGGGTPSLLADSDLGYLLDAVSKKFSISGDAEISLEVNPDDTRPRSLKSWRLQGINRLSVGLQSFNEAELRWMNRAHNAVQSLECLDHIAEAGFSNFSVDLIYGSPLQSDDDLRKNFAIVAAKAVPHLSCYALTVEPGTALNKLIAEKRSRPVDQEKQAAQFDLLLALSAAAGYEQYEISNFCKPGFRSRHNSGYWQGKAYRGFGPSAHSFDGKQTRRWNISSNSLYIAALEKNCIPYEEELLTDVQRLNEYIMTSLRTSEGLDLAFVAEKFGNEKAKRIETDAVKYSLSGRLGRSGDCLVLTNEGKFFADGIASDLFFTAEL